MSDHDARASPGRLVAGSTEARTLAYAGGAVLTLAYLSVLYHVVDVVGGAATIGAFLLVVIASLGLAAVLARTVGSIWAVVLGMTLLLVGLVGYVVAVPGASIDLGDQLGDTAALLSGMTVLRVTRAGIWALGMTPAPVFLSWYFFGRRAYGPGVLVGGAALGTFVLTGDLSTVQALVGVLGGVAAAGFGRLDREGADPALRNTLVAVLVAMLVVTTSVSFVPGGDARPLLPDAGGPTVESSLTGDDGRVEVVGSISLSPEVRYTVTAPRPGYWRVGAYDRYTGDGWVRTGASQPYDGRLPGPAADRTERLTQTYVAEAPIATMPVAWKAVEFESDDVSARVTDLEGLQPTGSLQPGDRYTVTSEVPDTPEGELLVAGRDYPPAVEERYLDLPESTPDRLERFTSDLTAESDSPYRTAEMIEEWLAANKSYSLDVERPEGDVASAFVFEMDAGYCTYFATAMVAMLRTQGIPSRLVVGYLPGQSVGDDDWLVRGQDSHAWVEAYFPGTGWVTFDPTPSGPRLAAEQDRLDLARERGEGNVDTDGSETGGPTSGPALGLSAELANGSIDSANATPNGTGAVNGTFYGEEYDPALFGETGPVAGDGGEEGIAEETLLYGLVLVLGVATAVHRLGLARRLYRALWLRRLPAGPPGERIEAAVRRAEYLLGQRYRPRRDGETRRAYVEALGARGLSHRGLDHRAVELFRLGERARYAGRATEADAETADRLLRELRAESGQLA